MSGRYSLALCYRGHLRQTLIRLNVRFGSKGDFTPANRDVRSYPRKRTLAHRSSIASGVDFIATIVIVSLNLTADRIRASFFEA